MRGKDERGESLKGEVKERKERKSKAGGNSLLGDLSPRSHWPYSSKRDIANFLALLSLAAQGSKAQEQPYFIS